MGSILAAALAWQSPCFATLVKAVPLGNLVESSGWVVVGTVTSATCHYEYIGGVRRIVTESTVQVDHVVSQRVLTENIESTVVTVRTLGGALEGITEVVLGEAVLVPGTTHLLFLDRTGVGPMDVVSMAQGQYAITSDDQGHLRVQPSTGIDVIVDREQSAVTTLAGKTFEQASTLVTVAAKNGSTNARKVP